MVVSESAAQFLLGSPIYFSTALQVAHGVVPLSGYFLFCFRTKIIVSMRNEGPAMTSLKRFLVNSSGFVYVPFIDVGCLFLCQPAGHVSSGILKNLAEINYSLLCNLILFFYYFSVLS